MCILSFGVAFYALEHDRNENITSLWSALYWSVITITTVGYGDTTPKTTLGCVLAGVLSFMGFLVFAIPTGIISSTFMVLIEKNRSRIRDIADRLRGFVVMGETKAVLSEEEEESKEVAEQKKKEEEAVSVLEWNDLTRDVLVCAQCEQESKNRPVICGHKENILTTTKRYLLDVEHEIEIAESKMREIQRLLNDDD